MGRYIFKRFIQGIISLLVLAVIIFILARMTGNPVDLLLPSDATEADREYMIHQLGLDRPYHIQFVEFMGRLVVGDFGNSIRFGRPASELYWERLPNSLKLIAVGFTFALVIALPLGVITGANRNTWIDRVGSVIAVIGIAAPSFWVGLVLMDFFSVRLGWLPSARMGGPEHYVLPGFSMCFFVLAGQARLLRSGMIETLDSEFVKLARIKGVSHMTILWRHCLRNALVPVLTFLGMYLGLMIGGGIVIETVFAWPGAGRLAYEGIIFRDYPLVQAVVIMHGAILIAINFVVDVLYSVVDPRIRVS